MNGGPRDDAPSLGALAERDYHAWIEAFDGTPGVEVVIRDEIRYRRSEVDHPYLNHAYRARLRPPPRRDAVRSSAPRPRSHRCHSQFATRRPLVWFGDR